MGRFELFSLWFFLSFILDSFSALFLPMAMAATVGFYAGTFDPPTLRQMPMDGCAFGDARVHKNCQDIGKNKQVTAQTTKTKLT